MAAIGSLITSYCKNLCLKLSLSAQSQSVADNSTEIAWTLEGYRTDGATGYITCGAFLVVIDGKTVYTKSKDYRIDVFNGTVIASGSLKVSHDSTGKKSVSAAVEAAIYYSVVNVSGSDTFTLPTIPRASTIDSVSCASKYFTGTITYKYTPKSDVYYNRCNISLNANGTYYGVRSMFLGKKSTNQQTGTVVLSADELASIYSKLPNGTTGILRFTLRTYSDSEYSSQIGEVVFKDISLDIPNNNTTKPVLSIALEPIGSLPSAFAGLFIQGKTRVKANLSAAGKHGATIESYSVKVGNTSYGADEGYTSRYLADYGTVTVVGYATDSRGLTGSASADIQVIPYSKPRIMVDVCGRCDADGNLTDSGAYLKIKATRNYSPVDTGGMQKNFCKIRFRYKAAAAAAYSDWVTILDSNASGNTVETGALLGGVLAINTSYSVQIQAIDDIGEYGESVISIPTETVYMHRAQNALGLGKYAEGENILDVAWDAHFRGEIRIGETGMTIKEYILAVISEGG